jgi:transposase-like protein
MANVGRPKALLDPSDEERGTLERWARRRKSSQALAVRSRIVLGSAEGLTNVAVAARCGVEPHTVAKWRRRFLEHRLDGLLDDPRPGRPASITTDQVEDVVVATLESTPQNATHWSRAKMAERSGLSKSTVGRIWRAFELKPHRADGFKQARRFSIRLHLEILCFRAEILPLQSTGCLCNDCGCLQDSPGYSDSSRLAMARCQTVARRHFGLRLYS